ncbi:MAG: ATP-binding protein [Xanthobacteraceae bacterium]
MVTSTSRSRKSRLKGRKRSVSRRQAGPIGANRAAAKPVARTRSKTSRAGSRASGGAATADMVQAALAAFAHEVRTPLTGILAISELLATSDLDERERRWVDTIKASADHLSALATLFVDAARSGTAGLETRSDQFDLQALASIAADSLAGRAAAKGLRSTVALSPTLPGFVSGDPVRLRAALENLIDNAVKFTEQGSVDLTVRAARRPGGRIAVTFAVSDSGIGLSLAEIKRLFRPFSQANVRIASRYGGAGLGLSSVKRIARAMGGDVSVAQRRGGGTTFTLAVMLDRAAAPDAGAAGSLATSSPAAGGQRLHVLSVEDNPFGRVVLKAILTELGHQTDFVGRGEDALARIAQGGYDVVLMDMVLPGITGIEVIRRIRAQPAPVGRIPVVGVSGRGEDESGARQAGADAFLLKPVSPRALATALQAATRRAVGANS